MSLGDGPSLITVLQDYRAPAILITSVVVLLGLPSLFDAIGRVVNVVRKLMGYASPALYTRASRADRLVRQRLARVLLSSLDLIEYELHWQREAFNDIRVTVETPDATIASRIPFLSSGRSSGSYKTASLVKTLRAHHQGLISLQGAAGSGKSVALRTYCRQLLNEAAKSGVAPRPLCVYVNLRDLETPPESITVAELTKYIAEKVNPRGSTEVTRYFTDQFERDITDGRIVILLDSFDEVPSLLGAANIDKPKLPYVDAINALIGGGAAKCIVASREYKGLRVPGWTRLNLIGMSYREQVRLLESYGVSAKTVALLANLLTEPRAGFYADLRNPLYLSLLARFVLAHGSPPSRPSEMFEDYVLAQLGDADSPDVPVLLSALESFAKDLTSDSTVGLGADVGVLRKHIRKACRMSPRSAELMADQLVASRLLVDIPPTRDKSRRVAFAHRRVQEFCATRYVIGHPQEIPPAQLATEPRWRETAVALLQVAAAENTAALRAEIERALDRELAAAQEADAAGVGFAWSPSAIHLLELLVTAFGSVGGMPASVQAAASRLVEIGWDKGLIDDRKFALDSVPVIEAALQERLVASAFSGVSVWLRLSALRDISLLHPLPPSLNEAIRRLLITLMDSAQVRHDGPGLDGDLGKLYQGRVYQRVRRLLAALPFLMVSLLLVGIVFNFAVGGSHIGSAYDIRYQVLYGLLFPLGWFWLFQSSSPLSYASPSSKVRRFFTSVLRLWTGRHKEAFESDFLWVWTRFTCVIVMLLSLIGVGLDAANGWLYSMTLVIVSGFVVFPYTFLWGPTVLLAISEGRDGRELRVTRLLSAPIRGMFNFFAEWGSAIPSFIWACVIGVIPLAIFWGVISGIYYLLDHLAGHAGHDAVRGLQIGLLCLFPVWVVGLMLRGYLSGRRVRRRVNRGAEFGPAEFLEALHGLPEAAEAVDYLQLLRVGYPERAKRVPLSLARELAAAIEGGERAAEYTTEWSALVARVVKDRCGTAEWAVGVLDEVGKLAEFLRSQ